MSDEEPSPLTPHGLAYVGAQGHAQNARVSDYSLNGPTAQDILQAQQAQERMRQEHEARYAEQDAREQRRLDQARIDQLRAAALGAALQLYNTPGVDDDAVVRTAKAFAAFLSGDDQ